MQRGFSQYVARRYPEEVLTTAERQAGVDFAMLAEARDLCASCVDTPEDFVSVDNLSRACELAIRSCDDPWLGLKVGRHFALARSGALGAAASSCQRAIDMLELLERFSDTLLPVPSELRREDDLIVTEYAFPPCFEDQLEFHSQIVIATSFKLLEDSVGYLPKSIGVALPFPKSRDYSAELDCALSYNQPALLISYPMGYLQSPLLSSDPAARNLFLKACEDIARQLRASHTVGSSIRQMLANCQHRYPSLEQVADRLHVTSRTLRNRLARENLSYRGLVKQQRVVQAKKLLDEGGLSTAEISDLLGYGNVASFSRAFKRATGLAPSVYRGIGNANPATPERG